MFIPDLSRHSYVRSAIGWFACDNHRGSFDILDRYKKRIERGVVAKLDSLPASYLPTDSDDRQSAKEFVNVEHAQRAFVVNGDPTKVGLFYQPDANPSTQAPNATVSRVVFERFMAEQGVRACDVQTRVDGVEQQVDGARRDLDALQRDVSDLAARIEALALIETGEQAAMPAQKPALAISYPAASALSLGDDR